MEQVAVDWPDYRVADGQTPGASAGWLELCPAPRRVSAPLPAGLLDPGSPDRPLVGLAELLGRRAAREQLRRRGRGFSVIELV